MKHLTKLRAFIDITKISWANLSANPSVGAIKLLEDNPEKIDWWLSKNPNAMQILESNQKNINWRM